MKKHIKNIITAALLLTGLYSCKKEEYINSFSTFVDVYFDADQTALRNNGEGVFIAARYNGAPIEWNINTKKIKVIAGEGKFEFYDTRTGKVVAEKVIDVKTGSKERHTLFQPTMDAPVSFINPGEQDSESAAPAGYIKLKVANYAKDLIPFEHTDIKVSVSYFDADWNEVVTEIGVIKDVKNAIDKADYQLLPDGRPDPLPEVGYNYVFEFVNSDTGESLRNYGGTNYSNTAFTPGGLNPLPLKNVFTLYIVSRATWGEAPPFIKKGETFYEIATNVLFVN
ncbi:hypothetical protein [Chitinophaga nivalis]|uniref:DUF3823 domain-containing protein n=1 Tax=Chitinophaga nivalis TaxID=2991709 RepID=A0ABT3ITK4_9BACT|nr:hypothetical protein [Chitinophaga nivalis]MCW3463007.1 hypothetical protein [Chitinophaga nivalis]MCW3487303.1 hypothetical protein [Chitinophaga nivalis]